ncbi:hypothetical protein L1887_13575 [Cichorium endivia]|nr:hypothetical protein L1887_13575 [Cichorium endivia]
MVQRSSGDVVIVKVEAVTSDGGFAMMLLWYCGGVLYGSVRDRRRDINIRDLKVEIESGGWTSRCIQRLQPEIGFELPLK